MVSEAPLLLALPLSLWLFPADDSQERPRTLPSACWVECFGSQDWVWAEWRPQGPLGCAESPGGRQRFLDKLPSDSRVNLRQARQLRPQWGQTTGQAEAETATHTVVAYHLPGLLICTQESQALPLREENLPLRG